MRELKFRVWETYGDKGSFRYIKTNEDLNYWVGDPSRGEIKPLSKFNWEQFTGLKDKNGVDIYDGDILDFEPYEWNRSSFAPIEDWEYPKWVVEWNDEDGCWDAGGGTTKECSVYKSVIGNIHENPELIKK